MKVKAKPETSPVRGFFKKIKHETFSFIGLSLSLFVLLLNTITNYIIPAHPVYMTAEGIREAPTISTAYWIFTIGLIALVLLFLYLFLSPRDDWKAFKDWANRL